MIYLSRWLKKWVSKMARKVLAIWIKAFGCMELTKSRIHTGIPEISLDFDSQLD
jgi:hypothetical protein